MATEDDDFVCALSGLTPTDAEYPDDLDQDPIPTGWTRVTLERRDLNREWVEVQAVKAAMIKQTLEQIPEEVREQAARVVELQIRAQYAALEAQINKFDTDEVTVYLAPGSRGAEIQKAIDALYDSLGIEADDDADDDADGE
jgi:hypothetical protein